MVNVKALKTLFLSTVMAASFAGISGLTVFAQSANGPSNMPTIKPRVDQLGQMEILPTGDKTVLFLVLFLQVGFSIFVAVALASHLSMPPRHKG